MKSDRPDYPFGRDPWSLVAGTEPFQFCELGSTGKVPFRTGQVRLQLQFHYSRRNSEVKRFLPIS